MSFSFLIEFRMDFILCVLVAVDISYKLWFSFNVSNKKYFKRGYYWIKERSIPLFRSNFLQVNMHKHIYTYNDINPINKYIIYTCRDRKFAFLSDRKKKVTKIFGNLFCLLLSLSSVFLLLWSSRPQRKTARLYTVIISHVFTLNCSSWPQIPLLDPRLRPTQRGGTSLKAKAPICSMLPQVWEILQVFTVFKFLLFKASCS